MKITAPLLTLLLAALFAAGGVRAMSSAPPLPPPPPPGSYAEGQVLVKFRDGVTSGERDRVIREEGARLERTLGGTGVLLLALPPGRPVADAVRSLSKHPQVEYAEFNLKVEPLKP